MRAAQLGQTGGRGDERPGMMVTRHIGVLPFNAPIVRRFDWHKNKASAAWGHGAEAIGNTEPGGGIGGDGGRVRSRNAAETAGFLRKTKTDPALASRTRSVDHWSS
jgi:hypothetical protein